MNLVLGDSEEFRKLPPKKGRSEDEVRCSGLIPVALPDLRFESPADDRHRALVASQHGSLRVC